MAARRARSFSLTPEDDDFVEYWSMKMRVTPSAFVRMCFNYVRDNAPDIGLDFLKRQRTDLEDRIERLQLQAKEFPTKRVFTPSVTQDGGHKAIPVLSGHDEFAHWATRLGLDGKIGEVAIKKVCNHLRDHPEWKSEIPEDKLRLLEAPK